MFPHPCSSAHIPAREPTKSACCLAIMEAKSFLKLRSTSPTLLTNPAKSQSTVNIINLTLPALFLPPTRRSVSLTGGFVVDDDGLGYDDAGEEDFNRDGDRSDDEEAGQTRRGGGGEGDKRKGSAGAAVGKKRKSEGTGEDV